MNIWKPVHGVGDWLCRDCFETTCWQCEIARRVLAAEDEEAEEKEEDNEEFQLCTPAD